MTHSGFAQTPRARGRHGLFSPWAGPSVCMMLLGERLKAPALVAMIFTVCAIDGQCDQVPVPPTCTAQSVPSVVLTVFGPDGSVVDAAEAVFVINGNLIFTASCDGNCESFVLLSDVVGVFDVSVRSVGLSETLLRIVVGSDAAGCHPVTQTRDVILPIDETAGILNGAWSATNFAGQTRTIRFDVDGEPIGAILENFVNTGDMNVYIAYNGAEIKGEVGEPIVQDTALMPIRNGNIYDWTTTTGGFPLGFNNALMSTDLNGLSGILLGIPIQYRRLEAIPMALQGR